MAGMGCKCLAIVAVAAIAACTSAPPPPSADNSRTSLDWQGVYVGTVPCADCPGIRMRIALEDDGTFERSLTYLERNVAPFTDTGSFEWDDAGARITLIADERDVQQYQVGENVLLPLDRSGQRITGDRAALYRLDKLVNDPRIENVRWALIELNRSAVAASAGREGAYFELDGAQARVTGNASCNRFFGMYELTSGNRLRFDPNLVATRMACSELEQERELFDALASVDGYSLDDGVLSLSRGGMPLARFRSGGL